MFCQFAFNDYQDDYPVLGPVWLFSYVFFLILILFNMLISILAKSYEVAS